MLMTESSPNHRHDVRLRLARSDDAGRLLDWRNDPGTRAMYGDTAPVDFASHTAWLENKLEDVNSRLFIAEAGDEAVGYIRFDSRGFTECEISISTAPSHRGRGLALPILREGCVTARRLWPTRAISARVKTANEGSHRLFRAGGFKETARDAGMIYYSLPST
ncbi:MAG: N-acetyltransferase [Brevundimonas sp.]|nr:MAG: N-acetyltransferase [Brevundimonas sp.]